MDFQKLIEPIKKHPVLAAGGVIALLLLMRTGGRGGNSGGIDYGAILQAQEINANANVALAQIGAEQTAASNAMYLDYLKEVSLGAMATSASNKQMRTDLAIAGLRAGENVVNTQAAVALGTQQQRHGFLAAMEALGIQSRALDYDYLVTQAAGDRESKVIDYTFTLQNNALSQDYELSRFALESGERQYNTYVNQELPQVLRNTIDQIWHTGRATRNVVKAGGMNSIWNNLISTGGKLASQAMG